MTQTPLEILIAARAKIAEPERWTKGTFSRNAEGEPCAVDWGPAAVCWCALGAINATTNKMHQLYELKSAAKDALALAVSPSHDSVAYFNDDPATTHADVLAAFDRAIAGLGGKPCS